MKILLTASEALPFVKTGGLADVVGALPKDLIRLGADARVMIPLYKRIKDAYSDRLSFLGSCTLKLGWREKYLGVMSLKEAGVTYYFIDCDDYFGGEIYRGGDAENEQFLYFCRACLAAIPITSFIPDIIHANDWHTAMIPMLLRTQYQDSELAHIRTVFTIHNIAFQGRMDFGLMQGMLSIPPHYFHKGYVETEGGANMMKAAILFADKVTSVSPTYAREIRTPEYSCGLDGALRSRGADLSGIVNGIDTDEFNPLTDPALSSNYDENDLRKKWEDKRALRKEFSLTTNYYGPVLCMISRLTAQKGFDLVRSVLEELLDSSPELAFVMLGSGDREYADFFNYIALKYPGKAGIYIGYDESMSRRIYAGSDFLLMPSLFEPCGLSQLIAQRYGTLPIVRETGGLIDTVTPYNRFTKEGDGFSFKQYDARDMLGAVRYALKTYEDKGVLRTLRKNAMMKDNSFLASAREYIELFESVCHSAP